jgi:peptidoglycan-N-acetylglucosamine deacetylase
MIRPSLARTALGGLGLLIGAQIIPAAAAIQPVRRAFLPALSGVGDPRHVALTFDDGPHPLSTPRFLDVLANHDVHATFFLLGEQLARQPQLGAELVAAGHEVAVHGWDHRCLALRGPGATYDHLARARDLVGELTGRRPRWFRPAYGVLTTSALAAARRLGLTAVLWTAWGRDWTRRATPASVLATVTRGLDGGGTVLLHDSDVTAAPDSWRSALGALPGLLDACRDRAIRVGPLRDHHIRARDAEVARC